MERKKKFKGEGKEKEEKQTARLNGKRKNYNFVKEIAA